MEEVVKKVTELIKSNKTVVLIVLALIGILLITASGLFQKTDDKKESDVFDEKIYIDNLEKRIGEMVSTIKGAGESRRTEAARGYCRYHCDASQMSYYGRAYCYA